MRHYLILSILLVFAIACNKPECSQDDDCSAFSPPAPDAITCMMYVTGYYYDSKRNQCIYYEGSACNTPPFELKEDCEPCRCSE